jgi:guanine deaminase
VSPAKRDWTKPPQKISAARALLRFCLRGLHGDSPSSERYRNLPLLDCGDSLILPGLVDLHLHAPQYHNRALGLDLELLEWLGRVTYPEETRFSDSAYAERAYSDFAQALKQSATTRACIYATVHTEATRRLMELLDETGLCCFVGRVNMDRNAPDNLCEADAETALRETERWIEDTLGRYRNVKPILTPRFLPACSEKLLAGLGALREKYRLPVQSHLSENTGEVAWVKQLAPDSKAMDTHTTDFGLFGGDYPAVMAHCVHSHAGGNRPHGAARGVYRALPAVQHEPRQRHRAGPLYLDRGIPMGLGTDISGGHSLSVFRTAEEAYRSPSCAGVYWTIRCARLRRRRRFISQQKAAAPSSARRGPLRRANRFDAVVIDDGRLAAPRELTLSERLEKVLFLSEDRDIRLKYVDGLCVLQQEEAV